MPRVGKRIALLGPLRRGAAAVGIRVMGRTGVTVIVSVVVFGTQRQREGRDGANQNDDRHTHREPRRLRVDVERQSPRHRKPDGEDGEG